jgi:hypothetical protein
MTVHNGTLVLAWPTDGGTIQMARGMEVDGYGERWSLDWDFSQMRVALASYQGRLYMHYTGTNTQTYLAVSDDGGRNFGSRVVSLPPTIGGPPLIPRGDRLCASVTAMDTLRMHLVFLSGDPQSPSGTDWSDLSETTIDPAPVATTTIGDELMLAWTGQNYFLNVMVSPERRGHAPKVTFNDICVGGPSFAQTVFRRGFVYCGFDSHIYILHNVEYLDRERAVRTKYHDTTAFCPALTRLGNEVYMAWFGTDGQKKLNFAHLVAMDAFPDENHGP